MVRVWGLVFLLLWSPMAKGQEIIEITGSLPRVVYLYAGAGMEAPFGQGLIHKLKWSGLFEETTLEEDADITLALITQEQVQKTQVIGGEGEFLMAETLNLPIADSEEAQKLQAIHIIQGLTGRYPTFKSVIAYVSRIKGQPFRLELTDFFGTRQKTLLQPKGVVLLPHFDWGGKRILFTHLGNRGARVRIYHLKKTLDEPLDDHLGETIEASFTPFKEEYILALSRRGNSDLLRYDRESSVLFTLSNRTATESSPALSKDGRHLLYVSNQSGTVQIYQKDLTTGESKRMTFDGTYNAEPTWDPTGRFLAFTGQQDGLFEIFLMDQRGLKQKRLTFGPGSSEQPRFSPDGTQICFVNKQGGVQKLYLMRIDGSYKRRLTNSLPAVQEFNPTWSFGDIEWP